MKLQAPGIPDAFYKTKGKISLPICFICFPEYIVLFFNPSEMNAGIADTIIL